MAAGGFLGEAVGSSGTVTLAFMERSIGLNDTFAFNPTLIPWYICASCSCMLRLVLYEDIKTSAYVYMLSVEL